MAIEDRMDLPWQWSRILGKKPLWAREAGCRQEEPGDRSAAAGNARVLAPLSVRLYTSSIAAIAIGLTIAALLYLPADKLGLALFAGLAGLSELAAIEFFRGSRSRVSLSAVVAVAGIVTFGPLGAGLIHMAGSLVTTLTTPSRPRARSGYISWLRRSSFNAGMFVISTVMAGVAYIVAGGKVGVVGQVTNVVPLCICVIVQVFANMLLLTIALRMQSGRSMVDLWMRDLRWGLPISLVGGILGGLGLAMAFEMSRLVGLAVFMVPVISMLYPYRLYQANLKGYINKLEDTHPASSDDNPGLIEALEAVMSAYDVYTCGHSTQVTVYADALAEELGLSNHDREMIIKAGLIHDIGKIGVLDSIISKPGPLTMQEYSAVKRHPVLGAEIISRMSALRDLVPLVKYHHERWNGTGYPEGLRGEEIPLGARILALADALDALCSDRPYRRTHTLNEVVKEVKRCSGQQFDPAVVSAFLTLAEKNDPGFFVNSAVDVDHLLSTRGYEAVHMHARYLKQSMVTPVDSWE